MSDKLYELMDWPEIEAVVYSEEYAPREILGPHVTGDGVLIQCFFPGADKVTVKMTKDGREYPMSKEDDAGYFAVLLSGRKIPEYTYLVEQEGEQIECYDAYAFPCQITLEEEQKFKDFLMGIGDSIVVVADEDIIKVHVHTNHPGKAIEKGLTYGELTNMKIDNMREEHRERLNLTQAEAQAEESKPEEPRKDFGFVAVSIGQGMNDIFRELGVDYLIEGGQTMNPSTEDMLNAIEQVNAETVFILPNNKNIILAATQAQSLVEDKNVVIIPTTTVPQGISAIIGFDPEADAEENEDNMKDIIECVKTGEVTYAVRDTSINGITIKVDDIMGIDDDGIKKVGQDVEKVTLELLEEMVDEDSELISIYYGEDTTKEQAEALLEKVEETYGDCDVQLEYGGQPIYYFLLSVE